MMPCCVTYARSVSYVLEESVPEFPPSQRPFVHRPFAWQRNQRTPPVLGMVYYDMAWHDMARRGGISFLLIPQVSYDEEFEPVMSCVIDMAMQYCAVDFIKEEDPWCSTLEVS